MEDNNLNQDDIIEETNLDTEETVETVETEENLLANELENTKNNHLRTMAEFDNYKKRTAREQVSTYNKAVGDTAKQFLDVFDNLERATSACTDENNELKKGVDLIVTQFNGVLSKLKIETISPLGEVFDPNFHSAVMHVEDENFENNTVCEVFQNGYKIGDNVIRFAMVKVAN